MTQPGDPSELPPGATSVPPPAGSYQPPPLKPTILPPGDSAPGAHQPPPLRPTVVTPGGGPVPVGNIRSLMAVLFGLLAVGCCPPVMGAIALSSARQARRAGESRAGLAMAVAVAGTVVGVGVWVWLAIRLWGT